MVSNKSTSTFEYSPLNQIPLIEKHSSRQLNNRQKQFKKHIDLESPEVDHAGSYIDLDSEGSILGVQKIAWPFIITGAWCIISSAGFAILGNHDWLISIPPFLLISVQLVLASPDPYS